MSYLERAKSVLGASTPPPPEPLLHRSEGTVGYERNERNEITIGRPLVDRELRLHELQSTDCALSALSALSPPASELREPRSTDKTDKPPVTATQRVSRPVDRELRNQARALVAQLHTLGSILGWPELVIKPGVRILAGEDAWTKLLRYPAPGVLEAALEATKSKIEQEYPF